MSSKPRVFDRETFAVAMNERGVRVPQLAREANTSERYVRAIASGMVPGDDVRHRLAAALGVDEERLWPCAP